jgi:hypothetical protein
VARRTSGGRRGSSRGTGTRWCCRRARPPRTRWPVRSVGRDHPPPTHRGNRAADGYRASELHSTRTFNAPSLHRTLVKRHPAESGSKSATHDACGVFGATFRELEWKTPIFYGRTIPKTPNGSYCGPAGRAGAADGGHAPVHLAVGGESFRRRFVYFVWRIQ